ncbi:MAG: carbamoyl-phosphate synthase (glutamine-hydrolyzing) large subunit [Candidatus Aenigmarchaeota archaeon]|nr:carbamoyl-phosphate synthase (glutamine-hydrolyzing) large subunit [Candidatus Aenigmarchaeota archaeon]
MIKKVLILGSGSIKIGEAGEFDYSGSQAIKALKEEGIKTILVNPNIATIQTGEKLADKVYFLPVNAHFVSKVIEKEMPDGILLAFGGQTALNCGLELYRRGVLDKHGVKVLGTPVSAIEATEDRELFVKKLSEINLKTPRSRAVTELEGALKAADEIGYPVIVRAAFALGGEGSGVANSSEELRAIVLKALARAPQILVEEYLGGWKEIEYEVVRDGKDNCITVCNMENFDPMGIHTGESIVVAPSQTLSNGEYHKLRTISIKLIRHLGIVGECNIQFALDPQSDDYRIIEVNARLSRSSALASKATGYPLAFIAAKLALGYNLTDIENTITKRTKACFEPSLDYIVVKIPRWDLEKFVMVSRRIGSEMKSVGEVMAIGRRFEEALQKAVRMLGVGLSGVVGNAVHFDDVETAMKEPTDKRLLAVTQALEEGYDIDRIHELTHIDRWFLSKIKNIVETEARLSNLDKKTLAEAKKLGFSDSQIASASKKSEHEIRHLRKEYGIMPAVKQIDTLGAEYPAETNYLYTTYNGDADDVGFREKHVIVLGSGTYSIGSSVEFDWCCVNAVFALRDMGYKVIMVNYNPETVSTDYDICDRLYFEELSLERILDICEKESPLGVVISLGGQIPNNLAKPLAEAGVRILGTSADSIDMAENRYNFSRLLDTLNIEQPEWKELTTAEDAKEFSRKIGYPVIVRPSYVLSGSAMNVASNETELVQYLDAAAKVSREHPIVISKFIDDAKEIEIDGVASNGELVLWAITEHVENAGVHSGDATIIFPAQKIYVETVHQVQDVTEKIARQLKITGPFNIQFVAKDNRIKVIECNLRASRSFPFVSKISKRNFVEAATKCIMGLGCEKTGHAQANYVGVKAPQFSFSRLRGSDPVLRVEMASTGEVGCIGRNFHEAFLKSLLSTGFRLPKKNILLSTGPLKSKAYLLESVKKLREMGFSIYATKGTADFLRQYGIDAEILRWPSENGEPNTLTYLKEGMIDFVINIPKSYEEEELSNDYLIRRTAVEMNIPLLTNPQNAKALIETISEMGIDDLEIKAWDEYN